jgi:hypothetical protein
MTSCKKKPCDPRKITKIHHLSTPIPTHRPTGHLPLLDQLREPFPLRLQAPKVFPEARHGLVVGVDDLLELLDLPGSSEKRNSWVFLALWVVMSFLPPK